MKSTMFILLVILAFATLNAQTAIRQMPDSSAVTIITKVPFDGKNYFITIVPVDSTNTDNMPILDPSRTFRPTVIWRDSLGRLFPDSIVNFLKEYQKWKRQK